MSHSDNLGSMISGVFPAWEEIPAVHRQERPVGQREYLVDGEIRIWEGKVQEVLSPIWIGGTGGFRQHVVGHYPLLTRKEVDEILDSAQRAYGNGFGQWPTMTVQSRIEHVEDFLMRMTDKRDEVVKLLMWEVGKTLQDSEKEFDRTVGYIQDTIGALKELDMRSSGIVTDQGVMAQIRRAPLGVVLCMGPFNYPLNETFTTLIPALIMGNVVIFKPPRLGVLLHRPLLEAFRDAFPPGVVNTVYGDGQEVIAPMMQSGKIDVLAFIGSSRVADILKHQHPSPHRLRSVLGLEAKNAGIILEDADMDLAVDEVLTGALSFNGQRCTALKIIFVHRKVAEGFIGSLSGRISTIACGMPWEKGVMITPLPEQGKPRYLGELIDDAVVHGARVINEAGGIINRSFFFPALLYPVNDRMRVWHEEQFGPVIPVVPFDDLDTPLRYISESDFGQQASIFGRDAGRIAQLIDPLVNHLCRINLNSQCQRGPDTFPFTGRKNSAEGTLSVTDALRVFSIRTLVAAKYNTQNRELVNRILQEHQSAFLRTGYVL
ncbi:MAG: NADP-dependent glyceraldehyde-3-phosphate dehydrogenase [Bacteroidales bacterium]|nr:NADP-dependent glyceraldehyde-3-phosphate dehydrogenase [Bacteroidales bacterium]